ncbi:MAG: hypothetical protein WCP22_00455 [Chlamydiota bacterium]
MFKKILCAVIAALSAMTCTAQSTEPVGPSGWTARNWAGICVQIILFVLALIGVWALAGRDRE